MEIIRQIYIRNKLTDYPKTISEKISVMFELHMAAKERVLNEDFLELFTPIQPLTINNGPLYRTMDAHAFLSTKWKGVYDTFHNLLYPDPTFNLTISATPCKDCPKESEIWHFKLQEEILAELEHPEKFAETFLAEQKDNPDRYYDIIKIVCLFFNLHEICTGKKAREAWNLVYANYFDDGIYSYLVNRINRQP